MKKILILIFILIFLLLGCSNIIKTTTTTKAEKLYEITVYKTNFKGNVIIGALVEETFADRESLIKNIIEGQIKKLKKTEMFDIYKYEAKEIIYFSNKDIRFRNTNDIEQFINADYIEIKQLE